MSNQGDGLVRKTQKGLSILAFETTKQSRILKKRMRIAALQKEIKADLRDLGNLVYNALINSQKEILEEEEIKILVDNVRENKEEVEHLRDAVARLARTKKQFSEEDEFDPEAEMPAPRPDDDAGVTVESSKTTPPPATDPQADTAKELEEAVLEPVTEAKPAPAKQTTRKKAADSAEKAADAKAGTAKTKKATKPRSTTRKSQSEEAPKAEEAKTDEPEKKTE